MKKISFIIIISAIVFTSCGKYEEGPGISLRSKKSRIENTWDPVKVIINSVDVTEPNTTNYQYSFDKEGGFKLIYETVTWEGTWKFDDKKEQLLLEWEVQWLSTFITKNDTFDILMLKNDELWLKNDSAETHYSGLK